MFKGLQFWCGTASGFSVQPPKTASKIITTQNRHQKTVPTQNRQCILHCYPVYYTVNLYSLILNADFRGAVFEALLSPKTDDSKNRIPKTAPI